MNHNKQLNKESASNDSSLFPKEIKSFLLRALIIFLIWKLIYHTFLTENRTIDRPLTNITAKLSSFLYGFVYKEPFVSFKETIDSKKLKKSVIYIGSKRGVGITDSCNGLELFVLYIGFLFCFQSSFYIRLIYIISGISLIFLLNIVRCMILTRLNIIEYQYADFAHHYLFKMIIYSIIFALWVKFSKQINFNINNV